MTVPLNFRGDVGRRDAGCHPRLARGKDRILGHLRTGAGRRRNRQHWQRGLAERLAPSNDFQKLEGVLRIGQQRRGRLTEVDRAAAAARHHQLCPELPAHRHGGQGVLDARLGLGAHHGKLQPRMAQQRLPFISVLTADGRTSPSR
jgi:hypothetical protein